MNYFKEYAVNIITVSVIAVIFENIIPEKKQHKYIESLIGLIIMINILRPLGAFLDFKSNFSPSPKFEIESSEKIGDDLLKSQFENDVSEAVTKKAKELCGEDISLNIYAETNESGEITGFEKIEASPYSEKTSEIISSICGISPEKIVPKPEN